MTGAEIADAAVERGLHPAERDAKAALFDRALAALAAPAAHAWWVPGRLEIFGKHTDYAGGRSLVCAVPRGFAVVARPRRDSTVHVIDGVGGSTFTLERGAPDRFAGWRHYINVVARRLARNFPAADAGVEIAFASDLPEASGMSSSSALVVGAAAALARVRHLDETEAWRANVRDAIAASGYYACIENGLSFRSLGGDAGVGTHGGSEDHAAIVTGASGMLSAFAFVPLRLVRQVEMPRQWAFVIATSATRAEKTGSAQDRYNRLSEGTRVLLDLWNERHPSAFSLGAALAEAGDDAVRQLHGEIDRASPARMPTDDLHRRLDHFVREDARIPAAVDAFANRDAAALDALSAASQDDADRLLQNQIDETRALAASARACGALAACSFGAGFGGSVWALVAAADAAAFARAWHPSAFAARPAPGLMEF